MEEAIEEHGVNRRRFLSIMGASVASSKPAGTRYVVPNGKKKNAWGTGAAPTSVVQGKQAVASVASAAANQGPQGGTATKFMAKQKKQQNQIIIIKEAVVW